MKKWIPERLAAAGLLVVLALFVVFHILVLARIVPYHLVWGGRLSDPGQIYTLEAIALAVNLLLLGVAAMRAGWKPFPVTTVFYKITFWILFLFFLFNTLGNLLSGNRLEQFLFAPLTLLLALFSLRLTLGPYPPSAKKV